MIEEFIPVARRKVFELMKERNCNGIKEITSNNVRLTYSDGQFVDVSNYGKVNWNKSSGD